jgi:hypothetical protein
VSKGTSLRRHPLATGWRVDVPRGALQMTEVDHLILVIDAAYPNSQPRIIVPAAGSDFRWPHVEPGGLLCLRASRRDAPSAQRIRFHLDDATQLLDLPAAQRQVEFEREFASYWSQCVNNDGRARVWSLIATGGNTRRICYFFDARSDRYVVADDEDSLKKWLRNSGSEPGHKEILPTWVIRLPRPWTPNEFPKRGAEVTRLLSEDMSRQCLVPGARPPLLFEVATATGPALAAVVLRGAEARAVVKGFRHLSRVPVRRIVESFATREVERSRVFRADAAWVHGRGHDSSQVEVRNRVVAIVGCGSIGAALARLLAQAGVGELVLVDGDELETANVSRHLLGMKDVSRNKALALQAELRQQLPHLSLDHAFPRRFEALSTKDRAQLARADLIIAAGIDLDGEAALDAWRRALPRPAAHLSTWVEAHAAAGHALVLYGREASFVSCLDDQERPNFRLTDWPDETGTLVVEAGCGKSFQPHGIIDLQPVIGMAARLALDVLRDQVPAACRRVWMGDPAVVERHGGMARDTFTHRWTVREFAWP